MLLRQAKFELMYEYSVVSKAAWTVNHVSWMCGYST